MDSGTILEPGRGPTFKGRCGIRSAANPGPAALLGNRSDEGDSAHQQQLFVVFHARPPGLARRTIATSGNFSGPALWSTSLIQGPGDADLETGSQAGGFGG